MPFRIFVRFQKLWRYLLFLTPRCRWHRRTVLRIRIRMFLASWIRIRLSEVWIRILLSSSESSKKNLDSYCFVTSLWLFILEKRCNCTVPSKSRKTRISRKTFKWKDLNPEGPKPNVSCGSDKLVEMNERQNGSQKGNKLRADNWRSKKK